MEGGGGSSKIESKRTGGEISCLTVAEDFFYFEASPALFIIKNA